MLVLLRYLLNINNRKVRQNSTTENKVVTTHPVYRQLNPCVQCIQIRSSWFH